MASEVKAAAGEKTVSNSMLTGIIWKELLKFFFPLLLGTFFQLLYNTVDSIIVGRFVGTVGLSAVGGAPAQLINLMIGFFVGISSGATVVIAQRYGAHNTEGVEQAVHTTIAIALAGGVIFTLFGILAAPSILGWMNTPEEILHDSAVYLSLYCTGMIPNLVYNMGSGILRAVGDSKSPTYYLAAGALTNIGLDLLFVGVFHMGVGGAAVATSLSQLISAVLTLRSLIRSDDIFHLNMRKIRFVPQYTKLIIGIGVPAGFRSMMYTFSNIIIQTAVNGFGTVTVAAWGVSSRVDALYWMLIESLGTSATTMVGQNYGAGLDRRVRQCTRQTTIIATIMTIILSAALFASASFLYGLFSKEPDVIMLGTHITRYFTKYYWVYICIDVFSSVLIGLGDALIPTIITILGVCVMRIIWCLAVVPHFLSLDTVMMSYPISWGITSAAFVIYYLKYVKKHHIDA